MQNAPQWSEIYEKHSKKMLGICKRYVNDISLAEDLMHEGFIVAMEKQNTFSGFGSFEGWLRMIMINNALMYLRQNKNKHFVSDIEISDTVEESNTEPQIDMKSKIINTDFSQDELLEVIDHIPENHKMVFNMYVIDKFSHIEISKSLDINVNTSKSHLLRARKRIQELLYIKASEKEQKKDRKKLFLWWFFGASFVDKIYANSFSNFETEPSKTFDIESYIKQNNLSAKVSNGYFLGTTYQNVLFIFASITIGTVLIFYILKDNKAIVVNKQDIKNSKNVLIFNSTENQLDKKYVTEDLKEKNDTKNSKKIIDEFSLNNNLKSEKSETVINKESKKNDLKVAAKLKKKKQYDKKQTVIKKIIDTVYVYK